jgi:predicted component of type VI protein secretion system
MILLRVLSTPAAGSQIEARRFPFRIGRSAFADWRSEAPGVWEDHFAIELDREQGFLLVSCSNAITLVNGQSAQRILLHNGDRIDCGGLALQFWLSPPTLASLAVRECATWVGLLGLVFVEIYWFVWLSR